MRIGRPSPRAALIWPTMGSTIALPRRQAARLRVVRGCGPCVCSGRPAPGCDPVGSVRPVAVLLVETSGPEWRVPQDRSLARYVIWSTADDFGGPYRAGSTDIVGAPPGPRPPARDSEPPKTAGRPSGIAAPRWRRHRGREHHQHPRGGSRAVPCDRLPASVGERHAGRWDRLSVPDRRGRVRPRAGSDDRRHRRWAGRACS